MVKKERTEIKDLKESKDLRDFQEMLVPKESLEILVTVAPRVCKDQPEQTEIKVCFFCLQSYLLT